MVTIDTEQVWSSFVEDPKAQEGGPPEMLPFFRPYVEHLPVLFADQLSDTLTLSGLIEAKLTFLRYTLSSDFVEKLISSGYVPDFTISDVSSMLQGLVELLEEQVPNLDEMLAAEGVTERDALAQDSLGMKPELLDRFDAGTLTLGDVIAEQPALIVVNTV